MWSSNDAVFLGLALLTTLSPGPALLLTVSNTLAVGARRAMWGALGNALGLFLVSSLVMAGLGLLLMGSAQAFAVLKLMGAGYLIVLGVQQWRAASAAQGQPGPSAAPEQSKRVLFTRGVAVAMTNPKAILFFSALFPQFMDWDHPALGQFLSLTLIFSACAMFSHALYAAIAAGLKRKWGAVESGRRRPSGRWLRRVIALVFVGLGLSLLRLPGRAA